MSYTISEAAARVGATPSTLHYYDKEGLIPNIKRKNGIRIFEAITIRFLELLSCLKNTGMPIKRIKEYVNSRRKKTPASSNAINSSVNKDSLYRIKSTTFDSTCRNLTSRIGTTARHLQREQSSMSTLIPTNEKPVEKHQ